MPDAEYGGGGSYNSGYGSGSKTSSSPKSTTSVSKNMGSGVGGGNYASAGGGQGSGASYGGGNKTNTGSKVSGSTAGTGKGGDSGARGYGGSTTSRIGSAASAQRTTGYSSSPSQNVGSVKSGNAAARASGALNAGLGRDPSPISGALNTSRSVGVGGAALGSFMTAREPVVRNYLSSPESLQAQQAGWSDLSRRAQANALAREALNRQSVSYPVTPQGVFGPRVNAGAKYLSNAAQMGIIDNTMPSELSGMPKRSMGTYSGYGTFNVPQVAPRNTTVVAKNSTASPVTRLPDGTLASTSQYSEFTKSPQVLTATMGTPVPQAPPSSPFSDFGVRKPVSPYSPQERILAIEDVPPLATTAQGGLGVFGVSSPLPSQRPLSVPMESTTAMRDYFYGGGPTVRSPSTYSGYGTFNGPTINATPDPNAANPDYSGWNAGGSTYANPANVPPSQEGEPIAFPDPSDTPAWKVGTKIASAVVPGADTAFEYANDTMRTRWANMTNTERQALMDKWNAQNRSYLAGNTGEAGRNDRPAMYVPASSQGGQGSQTSSEVSSETTSGNAWQADARAYGYSEAQLKDPETRALIKQLWDMGFIPKLTAA